MRSFSLNLRTRDVQCPESVDAQKPQTGTSISATHRPRTLIHGAQRIAAAASKKALSGRLRAPKLCAGRYAVEGRATLAAAIAAGYWQRSADGSRTRPCTFFSVILLSMIGSLSYERSRAYEELDPRLGQPMAPR
jgi:hypothetical protein